MLFNRLFGSGGKKSSGLQLTADMHCHLLPGIDDGAAEMADTLEMARRFYALGYRKVICTPHILWEMYPNTPEIITAKLGETQAALHAAGIDLELGAAAEYYIDEHFTQELQEKRPLLTLRDNLVLVEISTINAPFDLNEVIFEMQMQDYQPVIAHPERYIYLKENKAVFDELKTAGCLFQLNILALGGHYGTSVQSLAEYLIKKDYYNFAGTDAHHLRHLEALPRAASNPAYKRLLDSGLLMNEGLVAGG